MLNFCTNHAMSSSCVPWHWTRVTHRALQHVQNQSVFMFILGPLQGPCWRCSSPLPPYSSWFPSPCRRPAMSLRSVRYAAFNLQMIACERLKASGYPELLRRTCNGFCSQMLAAHACQTQPHACHHQPVGHHVHSSSGLSPSCRSSPGARLTVLSSHVQLIMASYFSVFFVSCESLVAYKLTQYYERRRQCALSSLLIPGLGLLCFDRT